MAVQIAETGEMALARAELARPDLLLIDIVMPDKTALVTLAKESDWVRASVAPIPSRVR